MAFLGRFFVQPRRLNALFMIGVVAAIWIAYWPSLEHVPRADQWAYLIDTLHCRSLGELWSESYSYNRVRAVGPGDADLFRPILFALLVAEKHVFGNNFVPSQAISLLLHTTVALLLLALLRRIASSAPPSPPLRKGGEGGGSIAPQAVVHARLELPAVTWRLLPHGLTIFFALNFSSMELVVWAHVHGYLLFLVFVMAALLLLADFAYRNDLGPRRLRWTLAGCWLLTLLSAFTYELGQFFAVILGIVVGIVARQRAGAAMRENGARNLFVLKKVPGTVFTKELFLAGCFVAILPVYQAVNRWDRALHQGRFAEEYLPEIIQDRALSIDTLEHAGRFAAFTLAQPFFPSVTGCWYQGERIHVQEPVFGWIKYVLPNAKLLLSYGIASLFLVLCFVGGRHWWRGAGRHVWPMVVIPWALLGLYAAITVLGRMNLRPSRYILSSNSYYTYISLLFFVIGACALWQTLAPAPTRRLRYGGAALCAGLVFLGAYSSGRIWHVAERLRVQYAGFHEVVRDLEAFIAQHRHEPDFRLAFDMRPDDPFPVTHSIPFPLTLYSEWIDNWEPKYVVSFPQGRFAVAAADDWRRLHAGGRQLFPDLVRVGTDFNLWHWNGTYYGTLHWDDVFRPDLKDHAYVIVGASIKDVLDLVPVRHEEFMEDLRTGWCIPPRLGTTTIDDDYAGFELVEAGAYYYAVPAAEGPFRIERFNGRRYSTTFVAEEVEMLRRYVEEHVVKAARK